MQDDYSTLVVEIPLWFGDDIVAVTTINAGDVPLIEGYKWYYYGRYASRGENRNGKSIRIPIQNVIMGVDNTIDSTILVDHIDHKPLNNCRPNLRIIPRKGNSQNRLPNKNSTSCYRGVSWKAERNKWRALVYFDGRDRFLGYFDDEEEAARVASNFRRMVMPYAIED